MAISTVTERSLTTHDRIITEKQYHKLPGGENTNIQQKQIIKHETQRFMPHTINDLTVYLLNNFKYR